MPPTNFLIDANFDVLAGYYTKKLNWGGGERC